MRLRHQIFIVGLLSGSALCAAPYAAYAQSTECPVAAASAEEAPPPLPEYDQPPIPAPGYIWTPGYWYWNNVEYYWVPGTWVEPPQPGLLWTPGYWAFTAGVYLFHRGYWGPHVGFYGGVPYGFGYTGSGFEGGYWNNGRYFYNRSVTNIGSVHVTDVYNKTVIVNTGLGRASYNGGAHGIIARPTAAEEAIAREQHIPPTRLQVENTRAASKNEALFATTNHGKPPIAATARPGDFKGAGVMPAMKGGRLTSPRGIEGNQELRKPKSEQGKELENKPLGQPGSEMKTPSGLEQKRVPGQGPEMKTSGEKERLGRKPTKTPNVEGKPLPNAEGETPRRGEKKLPGLEQRPQGERPETRSMERAMPRENMPRPTPRENMPRGMMGGPGPGHAPRPEGGPNRPGARQ